MSENELEKCSQKELIARIMALQNENTKLKETVDKQNILMKNMNEMLVNNKKAMFGPSSEQLKYMD